VAPPGLPSWRAKPSAIRPVFRCAGRQTPAPGRRATREAVRRKEPIATARPSTVATAEAVMRNANETSAKLVPPPAMTCRWREGQRDTQPGRPQAPAAWIRCRRSVPISPVEHHERRRGPRAETPAHHVCARTPFDRNRALSGGFMMNVAGRRIYFAGETPYAPFFGEIRQRLGPPDLSLLPIGAYEPRWFMRSVHIIRRKPCRRTSSSTRAKVSACISARSHSRAKALKNRCARWNEPV